MEIGYHATLVRDATAAFSKEIMHAAHELNGLTYAHAIVNTNELVAALPKTSVKGPGQCRSRLRSHPEARSASNCSANRSESKSAMALRRTFDCVSPKPFSKLF